MILTHGSNSISRDDGNYILDNFVALYNGVTDSGYAINDGSFGQLLWDANGPIQAPNGQGTPYYARANFSGNNGGVQAIYDELKSVFSDNDFTIELYFYVENQPANNYVFGAYNNDRSFSSAEILIYNSDINRIILSSCGNNVDTLCSSGMWHHIAIVGKLDVPTYFFLDGTLFARRSPQLTVTDINKLRFRFDGNAGGIRIAQFALRNYPVWTSNFTPPTLLYKQI